MIELTNTVYAVQWKNPEGGWENCNNSVYNWEDDAYFECADWQRHETKSDYRVKAVEVPND